MQKKLFGSLPDELEPMGDLALEGARFRLSMETRRYGKAVTVLAIEGWPDEEVSRLATELKSSIGTGGTAKGGHIELQGDHRRRVRETLESRGYAVDV